MTSLPSDADQCVTAILLPAVSQQLAGQGQHLLTLASWSSRAWAAPGELDRPLGEVQNKQRSQREGSAHCPPVPRAACPCSSPRFFMWTAEGCGGGAGTSSGPDWKEENRVFITPQCSVLQHGPRWLQTASSVLTQARSGVASCSHCTEEQVGAQLTKGICSEGEIHKSQGQEWPQSSPPSKPRSSLSPILLSMQNTVPSAGKTLPHIDLSGCWV